LASPNTYTELELSTDFFATSPKLDTYGFNIGMEPGRQFDYFEPRVDNRFLFMKILQVLVDFFHLTTIVLSPLT